MLRQEASSRSLKIIGVALVAAVGAAAAWLVALGNPGNMGICGACFIRDSAGALKLFQPGPQYMRPEMPGLLLGAFLLALLTRRFTARSGGFAAGRFVLGFLMAIAALVFLGCPFRMLQRLGGGDLNAWIGLPGFIAGVGLGYLLERRGYSAGKTAPAPAAVGILGPLAGACLLGYFLTGLLAGPGPGDDSGKPPHAAWMIALGIGLAAGAVLAVTGFCAVSSARQIFVKPKAMLLAAVALVAGYAAVALGTGKFSASLEAQPAAHGDWLWNVLALGLLGLTGVLAGGCPVRQMIMAGEGNSDALVCVAGMFLGSAVAQNFGLVSASMSPDGPGGSSAGGRTAVVAGLVLCAVYGLWLARSLKSAPSSGETSAP